MRLDLDRVEIESAGSDPRRLAEAVVQQLPELAGPVPVYDVATSLDIVEIIEAPLSSIEACLQCDTLKSFGQIVLRSDISARRKRFSIAHELGHFLNERHQPTERGVFECTPDDMRRPRRTDRNYLQENEANRFAIELLAPRRLIAPHLKPAADLDHALAMAQRFDISREAAVRRYVELQGECLAVVFSRHGAIRYIEKSEEFPATTVWIGDTLPDSQVPKPGTISTMDETDPVLWLRRPGDTALFGQTAYQKDGYAITLLLAEVDIE